MHALQRELGNQATGDLLASLSAESSARAPQPWATDRLGATAALPYLERIQAAFGRHDISGVQAHTGAAASQATQRMGASAYTAGNHVVFGRAPDLHTAAHEAAHAIQQAGGARPSGRFGKPGDRLERHADAVADAVVRGEPAEGLLNTAMGEGRGAGAGAANVVQCEPEKKKEPEKRPYWVEFGADGKTWDTVEILKNLRLENPSLPRGMPIEWKNKVDEKMANTIVGGPIALVQLCQELKARILVFQKEVEGLEARKWNPPPGIPNKAGCQEAWKLVNRIMIDTAFGGAHANLTYSDLDRIASFEHLFGRSLATDFKNPDLTAGAGYYEMPKGELFVNEPTVGDVNQGSRLGDCFFMSALAAVVARDPALIKRNLKPAGIQGGRRYFWVLLYQRTGGSANNPTFIEAPQLVDDSIGTAAMGGHASTDVIYAHSTETAHTKIVEADPNAVYDPLDPNYMIGNGEKTGEQPDFETRELWPSLYEKAYAKMVGGYTKIESGGVGDEALAALTGKAAEMSGSIFSDQGLSGEAGPMWEKLWTLVEEQHLPVTAGTWRKQGREELFAPGAPVDPSHAYTVMGLSGAKDDPNSGTVKLRDPRGSRMLKEYPTLSFAQFREYFNRYMAGGL